jgi:hypothetical protein
MALNTSLDQGPDSAVTGCSVDTQGKTEVRNRLQTGAARLLALVHQRKRLHADTALAAEKLM